MKRLLIILISLMMALAACTAQAATYTLPEKMYYQLAIGSGLKGVFRITTDGEKFDTPFLRVITDAEFSIRGILSGGDLHYYAFQQKSEDQQAAVSELYRKDGTYYFRSDMVQGKVLALPTLGQFLDAFFPAKGENTPATPFISKILSLPEAEFKTSWEPVMNRYQNKLELWLSAFTVDAQSVKMDNGLSAIDFTYVIPMEKVHERIIEMFSEITADSEATELLGSVMSDEEKKLYLNPNLLYFYEQVLKTLTNNEPVRMSKRVSAMGEVQRFKLELPMDVRTTGYESVSIENNEQATVYTLKKPDELIVAAVPSIEELKAQSYEKTLWFAWIRRTDSADEQKNNFSVRADITKTHEEHSDNEDKGHETNHYLIRIVPDSSILPEGTDLSLLPEGQAIDVDLDLHYSSKYAQNNSTLLEIEADIREGASSMKISGKLKTSSQWLFMPFEIADPVYTGTKIRDVIAPYLTEWISNAASIITHTEEEKEPQPEASEEPSPEPEEETEEEEEAPAEDGGNSEAEAVPVEETEEETEQD